MRRFCENVLAFSSAFPVSEELRRPWLRRKMQTGLWFWIQNKKKKKKQNRKLLHPQGTASLIVLH